MRSYFFWRLYKDYPRPNPRKACGEGWWTEGGWVVSVSECKIRPWPRFNLVFGPCSEKTSKMWSKLTILGVFVTFLAVSQN